MAPPKTRSSTTDDSDSPTAPDSLDIAKTLIQQFTTEISHQFKDLLNQQTDRFIAEIQLLKDENAQLKARITALETRSDPTTPEKDPISSLIDALEEREHRKAKEPNIVIYGLTEQDPTADERTLKRIFEKANANFNTVVDHFRMNKRSDDTRNFPALLKVITNSPAEKKKIMKAQHDIIRSLPAEFNPMAKYSRYFRDDLTLMERKAHGKLVEKRNALNETVSSDHPGKIWKVFKNDVVVRDRKAPLAFRT